MEEFLALIAEVVDTFERTNAIGSTQKKRKESFAPVAYAIDKLRRLASEKAPYIEENIDRIEDHYSAVFRIVKADGNSAEQHLAWARAAITGIKRSLRSVEQHYGSLERRGLSDVD